MTLNAKNSHLSLFRRKKTDFKSSLSALLTQTSMFSQSWWKTSALSQQSKVDQLEREASMTLNAKNSHLLSLTKGSITFSLLVWLYTKYTCFLCDFLSSLQLVAANIANITILQYCKATPALSSFYAGFPPRPLLITSYYSETAICKKHVNFTLVLCDVHMKTREKLIFTTITGFYVSL